MGNFNKHEEQLSELSSTKHSKDDKQSAINQAVNFVNHKDQHGKIFSNEQLWHL